MDATDLLNVSNEELERIWMDGFQKWMNESRKCDNIESDYEGQQEIYSRFAKIYDKAIEIEKYSGPMRISEKITSIYPNDKEINVLDYGCGTGLVADALFDKGYHNVDGLDCNQDLLDVSESKKHTRKHLLGCNTDGLDVIDDDSYDIVASTGVFFLSPSHPGTDCIKGLCRIVKPGGYITILTKVEYLSMPYVDMTVVDKLVQDGILKKISEEKFEGYRQPFQFEEDSKSMGIILTYQIN